MKVTPELLEKYYLGSCNAEERKAVERWQAGLDATTEMTALQGSDSAKHAAEAWDELVMFIEPEKPAGNPTEPSIVKPQVKHYRLWFQLAACLLLITGIALFFKPAKQDKTAEIALQYKSIKMPKGKKGKLVLLDGTIVELNSESEIRYPIQFAHNSRKIYLSGEAYFTVAKDKSKPFIIYTTSTMTQVLGTAFNLKAYHHEPVTLNVAEGSVRFGSKTSATHTAIYTAGMQGIFSTNKQLVKANADYNDAINWKNNKLVFKGQPLSEIIPVLERWYGVTIKLHNKTLSSYGFTGTFDNQSLSFVLDRIAYVIKFNYSIQKDKIIIN